MKINKKTKQILKYFAFLLTTIVLLIVLSSAIIGYFYGDKVATFIIKELNKNIETKIELKKVKFSALRKFPNASIELIDVSISASKKVNYKQFDTKLIDNFISAKRIFLSFNLMDIFKENYKIKWLEVENADINILIDSKNKKNYHFWKEKSSNTNNSFSLQLQSVSLTDCNLTYIDLNSSFSTISKIKKLKLSGKFKPEASDLSIETDLFINSINYKNITYVEKKFAFADLELEQDSSIYKFKDVDLRLNTLDFTFQGQYNSNDENIAFNLNGNELDYKKLTEIIPTNYLKNIPDFKEKGEIDFDFSFQNSQESFFRINKLNAEIGNNTLELTANLQNLDFPILELEAETSIDFSEMKNTIAQYFNLDTLPTNSGYLKANIKYKGKFNSDFQFGYTEGSFLKGEISIDDLKTLYLNEPVTVNSELFFSDNLLEIKNLDVVYESNNLTFTGKSNNLFDFLSNKNAFLNLKGSIYSKQLHFNDFISTDTIQINENKADTSKLNSNTKLAFWQKLSLDLSCEINDLKINKFEAEKLETQIKGNYQSLWLNNLSMKSMKGEISGNYQLKMNNKNFNLLSKDSKFENLDVNELFISFDNFWQSTLLAENIEGQLSSENIFSIYFDYDLNMLHEINLIQTKAKLTNGKLKNFEPLQSMSNFIKIDELRNIEFSELENEFYMKDSKITVPEMHLNSQVLDMELTGEYSMTGDYKFSLKVGLLSFLSNKFKKRKELIKDKKTKLGVYLLFSGNEKSYNIAYDKQRIREILKENSFYTKNEISLLLDNLEFEKDTSIIFKNN